MQRQCNVQSSTSHPGTVYTHDSTSRSAQHKMFQTFTQPLHRALHFPSYSRSVHFLEVEVSWLIRCILLSPPCQFHAHFRLSAQRESRVWSFRVHLTRQHHRHWSRIASIAQGSVRAFATIERLGPPRYVFIVGWNRRRSARHNGTAWT